jgi:Asp-tRNA(Asn)/Glu-tRNA(Gln) amidotransferase A subunit family amidase
LNVLINSIGRTTEDAASVRLQQKIERLRQTILGIMASHNFDAVVYATADLPPGLVADDAMTSPSADTRLGSNRRLAAILVFPAITVPAGFTPDGLPVGLEFMGKPFSDADLLSFAYAFEQATHHRRPPKVTPAIAPDPRDLR